MTFNLALGACITEHIIEGRTRPQVGHPYSLRAGKWGMEVQSPAAVGQEGQGLFSGDASPTTRLAHGDRCC